MAVLVIKSRNVLNTEEETPLIPDPDPDLDQKAQATIRAGKTRKKNPSNAADLLQITGKTRSTAKARAVEAKAAARAWTKR